MHPEREERIELLAGAMSLRAGATVRKLGPGDSATVAPGASHSWANTGADVLHFMFELAPAPIGVFPHPWIG